MATDRKKRGGRKTRKHGRNQTKCQIYKEECRREKSHIRRIEKHLQYNPNDKHAKRALRRFQKIFS